MKEKRKRSFFKIKEKLVFVQAEKKFLGFKIAGAFLAMIGLMVLGFSLSYWYFSPRFFQDKPIKVIEIEKKMVFEPKRLFYPAVLLDLGVKESSLEGELKFDSKKIKQDQEILLFGEKLYKKFVIFEIETKTGSASAGITLGKENLELVLPLAKKPQENLIIRAKLIE